jgi:hypothetical protein
MSALPKEEQVGQETLSNEGRSGARNDLYQVAEAVVVLQDYATTFSRDLDKTTRVLINLNRQDFEDQYVDLARERASRKLKSAMDRKDYCSVLEYFRVAAADMDQQYINIRNTGERLFDLHSDREDVGCDIDPEEGRYDETIDWYVDGPWMGPEKDSDW